MTSDDGTFDQTNADFWQARAREALEDAATLSVLSLELMVLAAGPDILAHAALVAEGCARRAESCLARAETLAGAEVAVPKVAPPALDPTAGATAERARSLAAKVAARPTLGAGDALLDRIVEEQAGVIAVAEAIARFAGPS
ncbi:MAG: hypothetical protein R3B72_16870 [Polyangiaceae bacterium]